MKFNPHTCQNAWQSQLLIRIKLFAVFGLVQFELFHIFKVT